MKATFQDFIAANPNCLKFKCNADAQELFALLNQDENIIRMLEAGDSGKPALAGCVEQVEAFFEGLDHPAIDFRDDFTRTVVGRMVKAVLEPFGYRVTKQKDLPKGCGAKYFTSASCYALTGPATMRVTKRVEPIA